MHIIRFVYSCVIVMLMVSCNQDKKIIISGEIANPGNIKVVAFYEGERKLDSVHLSDIHKFKFEREATQSRLLSIQIGNNQYPVIVSPGETLNFTTDLQNNPEQYQVEGSALSTALIEFAPIKQRKEFVEDSLQSNFTKLTVGKNEKEIDNLRSEYLAKYKEALKFYTDKAVQFAGKHSDLAGFYAMSTLDPELAEQELIQYSDNLNADLLENRIVTEFQKEIQKFKALAIGQPAPEIESYTVDNKSIKLSSLRGKYVLIDFWASWCMPCRKENPNLVKLYNQYHSQGFDILGVSLDDNPGSWMRAIEDDKLTWTNISDLKAWTSPLVVDYRIKGLPASVIIDPKGNILAKNLRGQELDVFLKSIFK